MGRRCAVILGLIFCVAYGQSLVCGQTVAASVGGSAGSFLYVKIQLDGRVKVSALKPGDVVEGRLSRDVYSGDREVFAAGSRARLTVDKLERRRRVPNDHWPWVVQVLTPRHESYPTFRSASVVLADGREIGLQVSLISIGNEVGVRAAEKSEPKEAAMKSALAGKVSSGPTVTLEARLARGEVVAVEESPVSQPGPAMLAAGTKARIILLSDVSAGKNHSGDGFEARVVEPVRLDSKVLLPEGTLLRGKVVRSTPPRVLSRSGSLLLGFTDLTLPGAAGIPASASVTEVELDEHSHTRIDAEGKLRGERPGKAWMLLNAGVTAGIAKVADDGTQLLVEAVIESATDASTAGSARIAGICASGLFMLTRHGRDVALPRFTEMNIVFDRPVLLPGGVPSGN